MYIQLHAHRIPICLYLHIYIYIIVCANPDKTHKQIETSEDTMNQQDE